MRTLLRNVWTFAVNSRTVIVIAEPYSTQVQQVQVK